MLCATVALGVLVWLLGSPGVRLARMGAHVRRSPAALVLSWLAIAAVLVSAFFATSPLALALTGSNERLDGALVTALWLALVPLSFAVLRRIPDRRTWVHYTAFSFFIISAYLLVQAYGVEPLALANPALTRAPDMVAATLGHPSLAGIFEGIGVLFFGILFVSGAGMRERTLWGAMAVACSAGAAAAGGRAGQVGIVVAWLALASIVVVRRRDLLRPMLVISALALGAFVAVGFTAPYGFKKLDSYTTVAAGDNASFNHRLITWRAGVAAIAGRPVFGYGADQAADTVWKHVSPAEERKLYTEFIRPDEVASATRHGRILTYKQSKTGKNAFVRMNYDKAHDYFIDLGLANGLVALGLFLAMVGALLWRLWRSGSATSPSPRGSWSRTTSSPRSRGSRPSSSTRSCGRSQDSASPRRWVLMAPVARAFPSTPWPGSPGRVTSLPEGVALPLRRAPRRGRTRSVDVGCLGGHGSGNGQGCRPPTRVHPLWDCRSRLAMMPFAVLVAAAPARTGRLNTSPAARSDTSSIGVPGVASTRWIDRG